ncbi:MAG TPA: hypothetical protein VFX97_09410 [Pyrinomonadaceae bacterium]|nr:hypothetical protein [Pyrinomonadaceae bacterium]
MKTLRLLSAALRIISVITFGASLFFGWVFYQLYLKWVFRFEDGRYFDPVEGVVYHDSNFVSGIISLFLFLLSVVLWLLASKLGLYVKGSVIPPARITADDRKTKDSRRRP